MPEEIFKINFLLVNDLDYGRLRSKKDHVRILEYLKEERRRTGRYVAAGTAIFLSLLGVYQAMARGTPEYAALFAPALIMFIYVLWILYATKNRNKPRLESEESVLTDVTSVGRPPPVQSEVSEPIKEVNKQHFNRSYSIA